MVKAAIYARFSTNKQREESIEGQVRVCRELAAARDFSVVHIYADRAESGKTDARTEFQMMIADAEAGLFDCIICYKNDRFARNRYDAIMYKHKLKKRGVSVYFAAEPQVDGPEGVILESVLEGFAEYFSANLAVNVKRGMKENALECQYNGGPVPIGYQIDEFNHYVVDPTTAPLVYDVFNRFASGETIKSIYTRLNKLGFQTVAGKPFSKGSVCSILNNEKYIGDYNYNLADGDFVNNPGGVPAIIGHDLWDKVQKRRAVNKGNQGHGKADYLLTGHLFCSCGSSMVGTRCLYKETEYFYYRCNKKMQDGERDCSLGIVNRDLLEPAVFNTIFKNILTSENIAKIADGVVEIRKAPAAANSKISLVDQKRDIENKIKNLISAIEAGIVTPSTKLRLEELESQKAAIDFEAAKETVDAAPFERSKIIAFLSKLKSGNLEDKIFKRELADILIRRIVMFSKYEAELVLSLGGGLIYSAKLNFDKAGNVSAESSGVSSEF